MKAIALELQLTYHPDKMGKCPKKWGIEASAELNKILNWLVRLK